MGLQPARWKQEGNRNYRNFFYGFLSLLNQAKMHMKKFITYLKSKQEEEMRGVENIDTSRVRYQTVGPMYDGWWGVTITLNDVRQLNRCVDGNDYLE